MICEVLIVESALPDDVRMQRVILRFITSTDLQYRVFVGRNYPVELLLIKSRDLKASQQVVPSNEQRIYMRGFETRQQRFLPFFVFVFFVEERSWFEKAC